MRRPWLVLSLAVCSSLPAACSDGKAPSPGPGAMAEAGSKPAEPPQAVASQRPAEATKPAEAPAPPATSSAKPAAPADRPVASAAVPSAEEEKDMAAARGLFLDYRRAIVNRRGKEAAALVSDKTIAYYDAMRIAALEQPAGDVRSAPLFDKMMILLLRARLPKEDLQRWSGRDLFIYAVDQGWVGDDLQGLEPGKITIAGAEAHIGMQSGGKALPRSMGFRAYREGAAWRLDVMSVAQAAEPALLEQLGKLHPDIDRALLTVVGIAVEREVDESLWEPLVPRGAARP